MDDSCTIFVNSCDKFDDCWNPFFKLLSTYWPNGRLPVVLNTENKLFKAAGMPVHCTRVGFHPSGTPLSWSQALAAGLAHVTTATLLYMQEDYFVCDPVNTDAITKYINLMRRENLACIQLTEFGSQGPVRASRYADLFTISPNARYRVSLQAALWNTETLRSLLRSHENAWQFEILGSRRSRKQADEYYCIPRPAAPRPCGGPIPYVKTGIIKGQWYAPAVTALFARHGIVVDYSKRGFFCEGPRPFERLRTLAKVMERPFLLWRSLT